MEVPPSGNIAKGGKSLPFSRLSCLLFICSIIPCLTSADAPLAIKIDCKAIARVPITGYFFRDLLAAKEGWNRDANNIGISAHDVWLLTIVDTFEILGVF